MLDDYKIEQPIVYKILYNAVLKNKLSHAYLFEANGYSKVLDVAIAFAKSIFCEQSFLKKEMCQSCTICKQIDSGNFPELRIISPDGNLIKKEQLYDLQQEFSKKAMFGNKKIYIISHAECLNTSSSNSLLKFIEEPEENIIAILIANNIYNLLDTIVSRCQVISFSKVFSYQMESYQQYDSTLVKLAIRYYRNENDLEQFLMNTDCNIVLKVIHFIEYYENHHIQTLLFANKLWHDNFKDKESISFAFHVIILYYKDVLNYLYHFDLSVFDAMEECIVATAAYHSVESVGAMIHVFIEMKENAMSNMNSALLFDKMILMLEEVQKCKKL